MNVPSSEISELFEKYKKFAVYGLSADSEKPSQQVPLFMRAVGYEAVGIYPKESEIAGFKIFRTIADVPLEFRKFLVVFRASDKIPEVVEEVLKAGGVEVLWLQLGISNPQAEKLAEASGLKVVSNRCLQIEYQNL